MGAESELDGENWLKVASIDRYEPTLNIQFNKPVNARYVKLVQPGIVICLLMKLSFIRH